MTATILPFRRRRVTRECAIEGCTALAAERRCTEHQAQLDANLAEMSAQHRARMDACLCPWCTNEGAQ